MSQPYKPNMTAEEEAAWLEEMRVAAAMPPQPAYCGAVPYHSPDYCVECRRVYARNYARGQRIEYVAVPIRPRYVKCVVKGCLGWFREDALNEYGMCPERVWDASHYRYIAKLVEQSA